MMTKRFNFFLKPNNLNRKAKLKCVKKFCPTVLQPPPYWLKNALRPFPKNYQFIQITCHQNIHPRPTCVKVHAPIEK